MGTLDATLTGTYIGGAVGGLMGLTVFLDVVDANAAPNGQELPDFANVDESLVTVQFTMQNRWEVVCINNNKDVFYYRDPEGNLHTEMPDREQRARSGSHKSATAP